mgnify:CR=1 FL=1
MEAQPPGEGPLPGGPLLELGRALLRASRSYPSRLLDQGPPEHLLRCVSAGGWEGRTGQFTSPPTC